jgi:hypothetical protein
MKKIILLALTALVMVGCSNAGAFGNEYKTGDVVKMHGCEYVVNRIYTAYGCTNDIYVHKGNCRFCKERRQKELEELVIKLKEK